MGKNTKQPQNGTNLADLEQLMRDLKQENLFKKRNIPERYYKIPKLEKTAWNIRGFEMVEEYLAGNIPGIMFTGKAGTGKTVLACKILHKLPKHDIPSRFVSVPKLLNELRDSYRTNSKISNTSFVDKYVNYETLVLDDLGAEKTTDWATELLYLIINGRYEKGKGLIVTTNCSPRELSERMGDRVISRLAQMTKLVTFETDEDWRMLNWTS